MNIKVNYFSVKAFGIHVYSKAEQLTILYLSGGGNMLKSKSVKKYYLPYQSRTRT
jgi:hypothetical protein